MTDLDPDPHDFYTKLLPIHWNDNQHCDKSVNTTIKVQIDKSESDLFFLNITAGQLCTEKIPQFPILVSVYQDAEAFKRIARDSDGSPLMFLGAISAMENKPTLTQSQVEALRQISGILEFIITGPIEFRICLRFGEADSRAQIKLGEETYQRLMSGSLDLQRAFFERLLSIEGNTDLAMRAALASLAPS